MQVRFGLLVAAFGWFSLVTSAGAADLPFDAQVSVGRPARSVSVRVANGPTGIEITLGTARHTLEGGQATAAEAESVALIGGASVGLITVQTSVGQRLIVAGTQHGHAAIIWNNFIGLRGDPGERLGYSLRRLEADGDGLPELGIAEQHEAVRGCDNQGLPVRTRWLNPKTLAFDSPTARIAFTPPTDAVVELIATLEPPTPLVAPPRVSMLRSRWLSAGPTDALTPLSSGSELLDRKVESSPNGDVEPRAVFGVSASGTRTRAIGLTLAPHPGGVATRDVYLRGDTGPWFHVTLPTPITAGIRHWVTLPEPAAWTCLELAGTTPRSAAWLAEVELFTDLDAPDGLASLLGRITTDDRGGAEAATLLVSLGSAGIAAVADAWDSLGPRGKRRAVLALAARAAESSAARGVLARASTDPDSDLRDRAFAALARIPKVAFVELASLAAAVGPTGDSAAHLLGESDHPEAVSTLLSLLSAPPGPQRASVREALTAALQHAGEAAKATVQAWIAATHSPATKAAALGPFASQAALAEESLALWATLVATTPEFEELWRIVLASSVLGPSPEVDTWLAGLAESDERWMVRDAALKSLSRRSADRSIQVAQTRLDDAYPRVRVTAVAMVAADPAQRAALQERFAQEPWPMVRSTLLEQATSLSESGTLLRSAVSDPAPQVRIAAISSLGRLGDRGAWPEIAKRLVSKHEWPTVMSAALQLARALCITDATVDLRTVLKRGLKPDAWAPDVDLALEAIDVLGHLGTPDARALLRAVQQPDQPQAVRDAAKRAGTYPACQSGSVVTSSAPSSAPSSTPVAPVVSSAE